MNEPAVLAEHLHKRYRSRTVVDDLSFAVAPGEVFGIIGPNGAGKTTTVELVAGLRAPEAGRVRVLGLDPVRDRAAVRTVLGVQLQEANLHYLLTVEEVIRLFRSFYERPRTVDELVELAGLAEQRRTRVDKLSGGQRQRLSIALALVGRPRVVILDELTTGLDPAARRRMEAAIGGLVDETVLLVSHAMDEVERLCDRVAVLAGGRIVALDTPAGLVRTAGAASLEEAFVTLTGSELPLEEAAS